MFCVKKNGCTMFHEVSMFFAVSAAVDNFLGTVTIVKDGVVVVTLNLRK